MTEAAAPATEAAPSKATTREWIGLAVLTLACLVYSMDLTVLNLALPRLSRDLQPSSAQLLWIIDIYGFLVAGSLITMGTLGDRIGRRKILLFGAAWFAIASLAAAFSQSAEQLIVSRALMGLAGATIAPSTLSLIFAMFLDPKQRTTAIGYWIAAYSAGGAVGPVAGGILLEFFWWGSVFLLGVPVMALLILIGPRFLPEYRDENARRLDLRSAAMSLAAILLVIYALKEIAQDGLSARPLLAIALGIVIGAFFVRRQLTLESPLIDVRLFRIRALNASLVAYLLGIFVAIGFFIYISQYLQLVLGFSPFVSALWSLPGFFGFTVGSLLAPRLIHRFRPSAVMGWGLAGGGLGAALMIGLRVEDQVLSLAFLVAASLVMTLSLAPVVTLATELIVGSAPPEQAGAATGLSETSGELGGALGIAVLGSIGTAIYRTEVGQEVPAGVPPAAADAARDTLGGAAEVARTLPDGVGAALMAVASTSFVDAIRTVALVTAIVAVVAALAVAAGLRSVPKRGEPPEAPAADAVAEPAPAT